MRLEMKGKILKSAILFKKICKDWIREDPFLGPRLYSPLPDGDAFTPVTKDHVYLGQTTQLCF